MSDFDFAVITYAAMAHAERDYPRESCGIISAGQYHALDNIAEDPLKRFAIRDEDYRQFEAAGIQAILHSHPDGPDCPTRDDMQAQIDSAVPWGIIYAPQGHARQPFFWGDQLPMAPLKERVFRMGVHDCYALIRDWFRIEKGILLPVFPRDPNWWELGHNVLADNFDEVGFAELGTKVPERVGDCVLARIKGQVENHCALYLGNGLVLHHLPNRLSRSEPIGPWMKYVTRAFRHKDLL